MGLTMNLVSELHVGSINAFLSRVDVSLQFIASGHWVADGFAIFLLHFVIASFTLAMTILTFSQVTIHLAPSYSLESME